jgi:hypothetical protein
MAVEMQPLILNMKENIIATFMAAIFVTGQPTLALQSPVPTVQEHVISEHAMSLETRYAVKSVNDVFKDNILLTLAYMTGKVTKPTDINWEELRKPATYEVTLNPGEVFAFHDDVLPEYKGKTIKTTNSHYNAAEGFRTDGYLYGDGVCHLASLINWAASGSGLKVEARVRHDFAPVPEVPREYGTSIYATGGASATGEMQNLYIENTLDHAVKLVFAYDGTSLKVKVVEK